MRIELHLADQRWPDVFDRVSNELATALGRSACIEHVGSTAIPGLAAKPIIDVLVGLPDNVSLQDAVKVLAQLGFKFGDFDSPQSESAFLHRPEHCGGLPVNLHLTTTGSAQGSDLIRFRTALRGNPALRKSYEALKRRLIVAADGNLELYTMGKTPFVAAVLGNSHD